MICHDLSLTRQETQRMTGQDYGVLAREERNPPTDPARKYRNESHGYDSDNSTTRNTPET